MVLLHKDMGLKLILAEGRFKLDFFKKTALMQFPTISFPANIKFGTKTFDVPSPTDAA